MVIHIMNYVDVIVLLIVLLIVFLIVFLQFRASRKAKKEGRKCTCCPLGKDKVAHRLKKDYYNSKKKRR